MFTSELYNRIHNWIWLFEHIPFPPSSDPKVSHFHESLNNQWEREMLTIVAEFEMPIELIGTFVEQDFRNAINYARHKEPNRLSDIYECLRKVKNYMSDNKYYLNNYDRN